MGILSNDERPINVHLPSGGVRAISGGACLCQRCYPRGRQKDLGKPTPTPTPMLMLRSQQEKQQAHRPKPPPNRPIPPPISAATVPSAEPCPRPRATHPMPVRTASCSRGAAGRWQRAWDGRWRRRRGGAAASARRRIASSWEMTMAAWWWCHSSRSHCRRSHYPTSCSRRSYLHR